MTLNRVQAGCLAEGQHSGCSRVFLLYSYFWGDTLELLVILWEEQFAPTPKMHSSQFLCALHF